MICTDEEILATTSFLDEERPSTQIARLVSMNLTNDEKDRINLLENTNNLASLRDFYLAKYQVICSQLFS